MILFKELRQVFLNPGEQAAIALQEFSEPRGHGFPCFGIHGAEGQPLQFLAHVLHAHAPGERRINFHGFFGNAVTLVRRNVIEGAHIVQAIGEFHQKDTRVISNGEQKLAQILCLLSLLRHQIKLFQLCQAFDQGADVFTKQFVNFLPGRRCVLNRVMQQRDSNG